MIKKYSLKQNGNLKLSENFKVKEFACKGGSDIIYIDTELVKILQKVRNHFNKQVKIISGYRTENYNKKVDCVKNSYHLKGQATDIQIKGISPVIVGLVASRYGANGIEVYNSFPHIDTRKNNSYWIG